MHIRPEELADYAAVDAVIEESFGEEGVVVRDIVRHLRASAELHLPDLMLLAEEDDRVVGFVGVSTMTLEAEDGPCMVLCFSPLGVTTDAQGRGIGKALTEAVIECVADRPEPLLIVEGDPGPTSLYRHYFQPLADGITAPPEELMEGACQMRALASYDPERHTGQLVYSQPFRDLES